jgi:hypothetical protein
VDYFPHWQLFDFEGLVGRIVSSSYLPMEGEPGHEEMCRDLARVFDRWQQAGRVAFQYRTRVYRGSISMRRQA